MRLVNTNYINHVLMQEERCNRFSFFSFRKRTYYMISNFSHWVKICGGWDSNPDNLSLITHALSIELPRLRFTQHNFQPENHLVMNPVSYLKQLRRVKQKWRNTHKLWMRNYTLIVFNKINSFVNKSQV